MSKIPCSLRLCLRKEFPLGQTHAQIKQITKTAQETNYMYIVHNTSIATDPKQI